MGEFSAEWLALREPADRAARSASLTRDLIDRLPAGPLGILDLGCGTGSNMRYIQATLKGSPYTNRERSSPFGNDTELWRLRCGTTLSGSSHDVDWLLVDSDAALLARVPSAANVTLLQQDLAPLDQALFLGRRLVTGSALLDLVSDQWLHLLAERCRDTGAAVLFALTYDGRMACEPEEPEDAIVRDLVNRHQKTDKGFGPALGPDAIAHAAARFTAFGYTVRRERSDWILDVSTPDLKVGPTHDVGPSFSSGVFHDVGSSSGVSYELHRQLLDGWADAAASIAPDASPLVKAWRTKRIAHLDAGRSILKVGHQDLAAIK